MPESNTIRKLGSIEAFHAALLNLDHLAGTLVTCRYRFPEELVTSTARSKLEAIIERAAAQVVLGNPLMRCGLVGQDQRQPAWVGISRIEMREHIEWRVAATSEEYKVLRQKTTREQLDTGFTDLETRPGWRAVVLRQENDPALEVMFNFSHTNMDGKSGNLFHEQLLLHLNGGSLGVTLDAEKGTPTEPELKDHVLTVPSHPAQFPPPQEDFCDYTTDLRWFVGEIWKELRPSVMVPEKARPFKADWAPIFTSPRKTAVEIFDIDGPTLKGVLGRCRQHQTTLTGLLQSLTALSLAMQLPGEGDNAAVAFLSGTAINTRQYSSSSAKYPWMDPDTTMANYISVIHHEFDPATLDEVRLIAAKQAGTEPKLAGDLEEMAWRAARQVREDIQKRLQSGARNDGVGLMKFVRDWREFHEQKAKRPRKAAFLVTNTGVLDGGSSNQGDDGWRIDRTEFLTSADSTGGVMQVSTLSVKGGALTVGVTWQEGVVDAAVGAQVAAHMESWLKELGS